jgi:hypothetical protein
MADDEEYAARLLAGSWRAYWQTVRELAATTHGMPDRGAYLPNPDEIHDRIEQQETLRGWGVSERGITLIMVEDNPTFDVVRHLVQQHGAAEAVQRLARYWGDDWDGCG